MQFGHVVMMSLVEISAFMYYSLLIIWLPFSFLLYMAIGFHSLYKAYPTPPVWYSVIMYVIATVQACWIIGVVVRYILCIRKRYNGNRISLISRNVQIFKYTIGLSTMLITGTVLPISLFHTGFISLSFFLNLMSPLAFMVSFIMAGFCSNFSLRRRSLPDILVQYPLLGQDV